MPKITKKVEKLRAFFTTKKQVDELILNLPAIDTYIEEDKLMMESFKRIFHKGFTQVGIFLDDLKKYGPKLDEYTIMYYVKQLLASPFASAVSNLKKQKAEYWRNPPDIMAVTANLNRSDTQTPMLKSLELEKEILNDNVVTLTKIPEHILDNNRLLEINTNSILALSFLGSFQEDNLLKYKSLDFIANNDQPHGSYMVADTTSWANTVKASPYIIDELKKYLDKEDYRMYDFKKSYNPFAEADNTTTKNILVERKTYYLENGEKKSVRIFTDLAGKVFESNEVRKYEFKLTGSSSDKSFKLHTVKGQLGSGEDIKKDPISS